MCEKQAINFAEITKIEFDDYVEYKDIRWFDKPKFLFFHFPSGYYYTDQSGKPRLLQGRITDNPDKMYSHFNSERYSLNKNTKQISRRPRVSIWYRGIEMADVYYFDHYNKAEEFFNKMTGFMSYCYIHTKEN